MLFFVNRVVSSLHPSLEIRFVREKTEIHVGKIVSDEFLLRRNEL